MSSSFSTTTPSSLTTTTPSSLATTTPSSSPTSTPTEQLLWKVVRAALAYKCACEHWQQCRRRSATLRRRMNRCTTVTALLLKTSTCSSVLGSAAKLVGGVSTAVGVVSKMATLSTLGGRLWRAGCVAKLLGLGGRMMAEMWERGFRDTLSAYLSNLAAFLQSMSVFRALAEEIEALVPRDFSPSRLTPLLLLVCPEETFPYACHVLRLFASPQHYSALHDFASMAMSSPACPVSVPVNMLQEVESFHVATVLASLPPCLQLAATVLHAGKELLDLGQGLRSLDLTAFQALTKAMHTLKASSASLASSVGLVPLMNQQPPVPGPS